jgi:uncharacterized protein (DUF1800 family)
MDARNAVAWLHRRAGFGLPAAELDAAAARGAAAELDRLLDPDAAGIPAPPDPWDDARVPRDPQASREARGYVLDAWVERLVTTSRPLHDRLTFVWHGWLVSAMDKVRSPRLMVDHVRLLERLGRGRYPDLLRAVTTDGAMLVYLDGTQSTGASPNENYSRELLELFALGVGAFTEADVQAGARALTGWVVRPRVGDVRFVPRRHDATPQRYLRVGGVRDVDGVIAAVAQHPALPRFVAARFARELLGTVDDEVVDGLARTFVASGLRVDALVRATLEAGLAGASTPVVLGPLPWLVMAQRVTGARIDSRLRLLALRDAGHLPMFPPNVAGWPGGPAWFAAGTVVARTRLAAAVAAATPAGPLRAAADAADLDALAALLGVNGFGAATATTLRSAGDGRQRIALALLSPELVIA